MQPTTVLLGYSPLGVAAVLPVLVLWDASIRRRSRPAWPATLQAVLGLGMLLCATSAVVLSMSTLASYSFRDTRSHDELVVVLLVGETVLGVVCAATLAAGLARPAHPVPRRGFTSIVLATDVAVVLVGGWYATTVLPLTVARMVAVLPGD